MGSSLCGDVITLEEVVEPLICDFPSIKNRKP
jgi:hypothetical protein